MKEHKMSHIKTILIPDVDNRLATETALCLKKELKQLRIVGCSSNPNSKSKYSRFIDHFIPLAGELNVVELKLIVQNNTIDLIFPVSIVGIKFCTHNQELIEKFCRLTPLPTEQALAITTDKYQFFQFVKQTKINVPATLLFNEVDKFSCISLIKPRYGENGEDIHKICKQSDFERFKVLYKQHIYQSFISGRDIDCSVFCVDGEIQYHTIQRATLEGKGYAPTYSLLTFLHDDKVLILAKQIMEKLKWNGVAHIDLRYADNGQLYIIEINARYWGSMLGSLSAGINFPCRMFDHCCNKVTTKTNSYQEINYLNVKYMHKFLGIKKLKLQLPYLFSDPFLSLIRLLKLR